ncbi:MAG: hypothetical protein ACR2G3_10645 [Solirubrobacterales bacterium]
MTFSQARAPTAQTPRASTRSPGGGGNDFVFGGDGDDNLRGDGGRDDIDGGLGEDFIRGDDNGDFLKGDGGADRIDGGRGNDELLGGADAEGRLDGEAGIDDCDAGGDPGDPLPERCEYDLRLDLTKPGDPVPSGEITFSFTLTNAGGTTARSVSLALTPTRPSSPRPVCSSLRNELRGLGDIAPGETVTGTYTVDCQGPGKISVTGLAEGDPTDDEVDPVDNEDRVTTTIGCPQTTPTVVITPGLPGESAVVCTPPGVISFTRSDPNSTTGMRVFSTSAPAGDEFNFVLGGPEVPTRRQLFPVPGRVEYSTLTPSFPEPIVAPGGVITVLAAP